MFSKRILFAPSAVLLIVVSATAADVKLAGIFSDHMVLQRDMAVPIWGTADAGEKITIKFGEVQATAETDASGHWSAKLPALKLNATAGSLVVSGKNTVTIKDVLVGDVWVCSGQSNMEMQLGGCNAPEDIASAKFPTIRKIKFDHIAVGTPSTFVPHGWEVCSPANAAGFTAVGFYFARKIQKEMDGVPIGLIDDNWGGTRIEPWIPPVGFEMTAPIATTLKVIENSKKGYRDQLAKSLDALEKWIAEARKVLPTQADIPAAPQMPRDPMTDAGFPTTLYNGMINPIVPFGIKGALWYQGESNGGEGEEYFHKMSALIGGWRKIWNQGDFPFYFVQLANFQSSPDDAKGGDVWAKIRMAQSKSLTIPNTGMAVIIDIGDGPDIHPKNKFDVGERLAAWALNRDYGKKDVVVSGPLYKGIKVEGAKIRVSFDYVGNGLIVGKKDGRKPTEAVTGGVLKRFAIAGEDQKWEWAEAVIDGDTVVVTSPKVAKPVAVRYAYAMHPVGCNLYNKDGFPASPFRSDNW